MYALFGHPAPATPFRRQQQQRQQHPSYPTSYTSNPFISTNPTSFESMDEDSPDEEERLLLAALERKRQQKIARQQYHHQQLLEQQRQQQLIEQRRQQLIEQELLARRRRAQAQAIAQAKYEAEQEAIRQYMKQQQQIREQQERRRQQAALEHIFLQRLQQQQIEEQKRQEQAAKVAIAEAKKRQQQQLTLQAAASASEDEEEAEDQDVLSHLLNAIFFPDAHLKRHSSQDQQQYPCKRRQQNQQGQKVIEAQKTKKPVAETKKPVAEAKKQQQQEKKAAVESKSESTNDEKKEDLVGSYFLNNPVIKSMVEAALGTKIETAAMKSDNKVNVPAPTTSKATPSSTVTSPKVNIADTKSKPIAEEKEDNLIGDYFMTYPDIKSMIEAVLGAEIETANKKTDAVASTTTAPTTATPSSTQSSPELRATDILKQRQDRQQQKQEEKKEQEQHDSLQEKHSELNLIDSALDDLSRELNEILTGTIENKKRILLTEENLTKTMLRLDSVQSDGDASVRRHRKQLIKKSQQLLDLVDEFKARESTTGKNVTPAQPSESKPEVLEAIEEKEEGANATADLDTLSVSDIESLPDISADDNVEDKTEENLADSSELPKEQEPTQDNEVTDATAVEMTEDPTPAEPEDNRTEVEPELSSNTGDSDGSMSKDEEPQVPMEEEPSKATKSADPLDLVDAALGLAHPEPVDHDFDMVLVH
ncbi:hypothetical protein BGZ54_007805 [Gamsiella multidivaricata]|nr:hypothetical protein BGZ54_007805 [Gamsiella multidivaricata]